MKLESSFPDAVVRTALIIKCVFNPGPNHLTESRIFIRSTVHSSTKTDMRDDEFIFEN